MYLKLIYLIYKIINVYFFDDMKILHYYEDTMTTWEYKLINVCVPFL